MNLEKYRNERRENRTEDVDVPEMKDYFEEGKAPKFTVRNLTSAEYGRCKEASARQEETAKLAAALIGGNSDEKAAALKELSEGPEVPDDIAERIEMLTIATIEPKLQHNDAVLISEDFPVAFYRLTNTISKLSKLGRVLGKPNASGKTKKSEPR